MGIYPKEWEMWVQLSGRTLAWPGMYKAVGLIPSTGKKKKKRKKVSKTIEGRVSKRYLDTHVHSNIIYKSQKVKETQVSIGR